MNAEEMPEWKQSDGITCREAEILCQAGALYAARLYHTDLFGWIVQLERRDQKLLYLTTTRDPANTKVYKSADSAIREIKRIGFRKINCIIF